MELITQDQASAIIALDQTAKATQVAVANAEETGSSMLKAFVISKGMNMLRKQLTDAMLKDIAELQGSPLGFRVDKEYALPVLRDIAIEAALRGLRLVGNEINIIAGRLYVTKEGYQRLVSEWPGLSDLEIDLEVPDIAEGTAFVSGVARFKINGRPREIVRRKEGGRDLRIAVKLNAGMGIDAALGKAKARMYRLIAERLSGIVMPDSEPEEPKEPAPEEPVDLSAWAEHAETISDQVDQCTDREQLERVYKQWHAYASNEVREAQLVNLCAAKAAKL